MKARRRALRTPTHSTGRISSHVTREGSPKKSYRTEREAKSAAQLAWTLNGAELGVYRCEFCHQWHMGNSRRAD
jgi:hypothetical protein